VTQHYQMEIPPEPANRRQPRKAARWWTAKDVAAHYRVSVRSIANWVRDGRLAKPVKGPNGRDNLWSDEMIAALDAELSGETI
jgi:hypothetical protein